MIQLTFLDTINRQLWKQLENIGEHHHVLTSLFPAEGEELADGEENLLGNRFSPFQLFIS